MLDVYRDFVENFLAISPVLGEKTESERFAGAVATYTFETMMQDGKALQSGTSHNLGDNFSKAFDVTYKDADNTEQPVYATSRGVSTRLMGGLIMSHSDDQGLVLPPAVAPLHVVIVPIFKTEEDLETIKTFLEPVLTTLKQERLYIKSQYHDGIIPITVKLDDDDQKSPGWKFNEYERKGVPIRIAIGPKDLEKGHVEIVRRDLGEKNFIKKDAVAEYILEQLHAMQGDLFDKNKQFREKNTVSVDTWEEFEKALDNQQFILAHRDDTTQTEETIQSKTKATIRCIPFDSIDETGKCILTGKKSTKRVLFARAY